ncbi:cleft lip and palate transmembrane protein 1 homolog [Prunus yedoensis var. nudiflora]|uniref:Cleft lip and palate transmembrane protein 1 homolog n=1 Tax=Prunus yedoensis var. nudiflora TaxID=2094558 RepID=A0A314Y9K8_PRUYE|nr:cleft lip and palate transmembrane protein 1 homolog [Prunus yedoensis var. nudiflora]
MAPPAAAAAEGQVQRGQQQGGGGFGQSITGIIRIAVFCTNLFQKAEPLDMWLYLSEREKFNEFSSERELVWHETNIPYALWGPESTRSLSMKYYPSEALKHNGSLYAHVFFARSGYPPDPSDPEYQPLAVFGKTHSIVTHLPKSKAGKKRSLLGGSKDSDEKEPLIEVVDDTQGDSEDNGPVEWVSYWKPNITINLVDDFTGSHKMTKWQLFLQIDQSFQIHRSYGSMLEGEADELKRVFLEGNPYLLGITMVVSLLHSVFDFLAFKNDIQFWNKNKSMEGLSAKSVIVSFICQLIVFLYLLDNETSWMILASSGIGCCIEFWKIGKAMHIEIDRTGRIPMLRFRDRESYAGNKTKEYDDMAMKYLSYVLFFLVACSSVYSLKYERHKSWYSWILSSLTSCVYMFGFIMMCPQLFINYKLKSVAHLPWRQMTYKFLNTIIDDLFAFVIKMPILHRLSVFRDDVIFLIYVYQRWKYPVDKKRVNEFGFSGDDEVTEGAVDTAVKEEEKKTN